MSPTWTDGISQCISTRCSRDGEWGRESHEIMEPVAGCYHYFLDFRLLPGHQDPPSFSQTPNAPVHDKEMIMAWLVLRAIKERRRRRAGIGLVFCSRRRGGTKAHIVGRGNGNAVFEWMPAHVQDLLVEVDLIGIGLFLHAAAGPSRATGS